MTISSDGQDGDYALLGRIILLWGNVEMELVNIILRLNHPMSQPKIKFKVPVPFDEKLKFAIMRYREIPEMVPLANQAQTVFATLPPLHKTQTQIVHGGFQGRRGDGSFLFN